MSDETTSRTDPTERRTFLHNVLSASAAAAGVGLLSGCATANAGASLNAQPAREAPLWDMSWQSKLGRYKTVYDAPEPLNGTPMYTVALTIAGYKAALPRTAKEFTPVLVLRHNASFMTLNDSMWKRVRAHTRLTPKDVADAYVDRNPFISYVAGSPGNLVNATSSLTALVNEGTIILVCNRALGILARGLMGAEPGAFATVELATQEIWKNLVPGAYPMPNGLFAVAAAQDAGCGYVRIMPD
jgi:hypothetical protein